MIWALDWSAGDEVITTTDEHPGLTAPLEELAARQGVVVREVAPTREAIAAAIGERTRLVAISHVLWTDGAILPVAEISADAHAAGARVLVDGAQGGGAVPFRAADLGCDYYAYSGQKWLCGPSGTGALWIAPDALGELHTPWPWYLSRDRRSGPSRRSGRSPAGSTRALVTLTAFAGIAAAIEWRAELGSRPPARALRRWRARCAGCFEEVASIELVTPASPSTIVAFRVPGREPADVVAHCEEPGRAGAPDPEPRPGARVGRLLGTTSATSSGLSPRSARARQAQSRSCRRTCSSAAASTP